MQTVPPLAWQGAHLAPGLHQQGTTSNNPPCSISITNIAEKGHRRLSYAPHGGSICCKSRIAETCQQGPALYGSRDAGLTS